MTELPIVVNMTVDASRTEYDLTAESNLEEIELLNDTVIETGGSHVPVYEGPYTVDAGLNVVTLDTDGKRLTQDVTVNALEEMTLNSPSISIDPDTGRITATVNYTPGYNDLYVAIPSMKPLPTQGTYTYTPSNTEQTILTKGTYITGNIKVGAIPTGTRGTPTATKGTVSNHSVSVTPSVTNTTGYITGGTINGTAVSVSASELVSGNKAITRNGNNIDVANYSTVSVNVQGVSGYTITNNLTNMTTNNATTEVVANQPYYATLSTNYVFDSCTVTMGDVDVTTSVFDRESFSIYIPSVTGNVVITADAITTVIVYTQGSLGAPNTDLNRVSGVITNSIHLDSEYLTISAPSGYTIYPFMVMANRDVTIAGTREKTNRLYVYAKSDSGYVANQNADISGLKANSIVLTGTTSSWQGTTITYTYTKSSQYGYSFTGLGFLVKKTDESNITPQEVENNITVNYHTGANADQVLNVLLGGETV